jgi:hypothetical protein
MQGVMHLWNRLSGERKTRADRAGSAKLSAAE